MSRTGLAGTALVLGAALVASGTGCGEPFSSGSGEGGAAGATSTPTTSTGSGGSASGGSGGSAGSGGTATGSGTPTGTDVCHPPGLFDDFSGAELDPVLWGQYTDGIDVLLSNERLSIKPQSEVTGNHYGELYSLNSYDLRNCSVWVEATGVLAPGVPGESYLAVYASDGNWVDITALDGWMRFRVHVAWGIANESSADIDVATHRWWRIREESGTTYLETSTDAASWDSRLQFASPAYLDDVIVSLGVNTWANTGLNPGQAEFDNVNLLP